MSIAPRPNRRVLLAAACAGVALAAFGRASARAGSPAAAPDVAWHVHADGGVSVVVSGVCAGAWRCVVYGPPCSRGELCSSPTHCESSAAFDLGVVDAGHYCVRVERADAERELLAGARCRHDARAR